MTITEKYEYIHVPMNIILAGEWMEVISHRENSKDSKGELWAKSWPSFLIFKL